MLDRVGYYCWGGPGTIRMIKVKYFKPRIDHQSLLTCYDYEYITNVKDRFDVTDFWVTYSWGFSDQTEQEDRDFIVRRLDNFKRLGIRVHAYIQGPNLVYDEFSDKDWWARDENNRLIPYYKGRRLCSIHNEEYINYVTGKIEGTYGLGFDGIYIDNIQHGQLGVPAQQGKLPFVFCGDYSAYARQEFRQLTGCDIPADLERDLDLTRAYLDFRVQANTRFISRLSLVTHAGHMQFGTNFYDPKFDPWHIYAIDLQKMASVQDYILFENHALPSSDGKISNRYIESLIDSQGFDKPVFVLSYRNGIGMAPEFSQEDVDNIFSEAASANFLVSLKGSEFTTKGVWHNLDPVKYRAPRTDKTFPVRREKNRQFDALQFLMKSALLRRAIKRYYNPLYRAAFEWPALRFLVNVAYNTTLK